MNSIASQRTRAVAEVQKKLLVGYVLAGYPSSDSFFSTLKICEKSPLDIIEIGFPSQNPFADGPVIATAHKATDKQTACSLAYWEKIRKATDKPIWLMAYSGDFIGSGVYRKFAKNRLIDGMVVPDASLAVRKEIRKEVGVDGIDVIGFVNPKMSGSKMDEVFSDFPLVYEQLYVGQTGTVQIKDVYHPMLERSLTRKDVLGFAGFGISTAERVAKLYADGFHGAIIGTEIIKRLNVSPSALETYLKDLGRAKEQWQ